MARKYLYALALLVAIAVASNVNQRGYVGVTRAVNSTNVSRQLILGRRRPGDWLVLRQNVFQRSSWMKILIKELTFNATRYEIITLVRALDRGINGTGAHVTVLGGGPEYRNVTLKFKSQRGYAIDYIVELYARN